MERNTLEMRAGHFGPMPMRYLVVPRVLAGIIVMPILVLIADIIGVLGGWLIAVYRLGYSSVPYLNNSLNALESGDVALLKGSGWIGNESHGLVHRSPALAEGQPRLLLTIDPG